MDDLICVSKKPTSYNVKDELKCFLIEQIHEQVTAYVMSKSLLMTTWEEVIIVYNRDDNLKERVLVNLDDFNNERK